MTRDRVHKVTRGALFLGVVLLGVSSLGLYPVQRIAAGTGISVATSGVTTTISSTVVGGVSSVTGSSGVSCSPTSGAVTCSSTLTLPTVASGTGITVTGGPAYTVALTTPVAAANGGTGQTALAAHNVLLGEGTAAVGLASPSTSGQPLLSTGGSSDPSFGPLSLSGAGVTSVLGVANGGTGASSFTSGSLLLGSGTGALSLLAPGSAGNITQSNGLGAWTANQFHSALAGALAAGFWTGTDSTSTTAVRTTSPGPITQSTGSSVIILACFGFASNDTINNQLTYGIGVNTTLSYAANNAANQLSNATTGGTSFTNTCKLYQLTGLTVGSNTFYFLFNLNTTPGSATSWGATGILFY